MKVQEDNVELQKASVHVILQIIEYVPHAVLSKTILKKTTGNVTALAFSAGEQMDEKMSPFDNFIQIIDGVCQLIINGKEYKLSRGDGIIIPAHSTHNFSAAEQFKMLCTIIKSGYENF